jgi:hypothetical protein
MIGSKKLSEIRDELRAAMAAGGSNVIASLDRRIRTLKRKSASAKEARSLLLLRSALARVIEEKPRRRSRRGTRTKKTV